VARQDPKEHSKLREALANAEAELNGREVVPAMVPIEPDALLNTFNMLKSFGKKWPTLAGPLVERVGKMLGATAEEMAEGMKVRPRNDWAPYRSTRPAAGVRLSRRDVPEDMNYWKSAHPTAPPPQGPNEVRAAKAAARATEKIITHVEKAIKRAPEQ
jgi:hypothetical protein